MFAPKQQTNPLSFIASGCVMSGDLDFAGDVLIAGTIKGNIVTNGNVTIEVGGEVFGTIECQLLHISGLHKGTAKCQKLTITDKGTFEGDAYNQELEIISGGQFLGQRHAPEAL